MSRMSVMRRRFCAASSVLTALALACGAIAQGDAGPPPGAPPGAAGETGEGTAGAVTRGLETPAEAVRTFLDAMRAEPPDYDRAIACLDLSGVPEDAGRQQAIKLYGIIIRIEDVKAEHGRWLSMYLHPGRERTVVFFPRQRTVTPQARRRHEQLQRLLSPGESIVLAQSAGVGWRFSADTVGVIESLYDKLKDEPAVAGDMRDERELSAALWFEDQLPAWALQRVLGLKYWQWLGLLILIFIGMVLDFTVRFWLRVVSRRAIERRGGEAKAESIKRTVRPFGLAVMALFWLLLLRVLELPPGASAVLHPAARLFFTLAAVWALFRVIDLIGELAIARAARTATKFDDLLVPLVRKTVKIFIAVFGLIYVADSLHISIVPLLTGLGIGGVGFAFAAKDTLEHFFGSVTVIADRPFQVGDWVLIGDTEGTVEEVGFRSTRIRTFYNSLVTIPNGNLVRAVVDNYGKRKYRRWSTHINLTYDTPPEKLEAFCEGLRELVRLHPYTRKDYYQIWLHQFGAHSLDVLLYVFWQTPDWQTELRERHRLLMDVLRLADRLGVEFAFPTQTLHVYKEEEEGEHRAAEAPGRGEEVVAQRSGRVAARDVTAAASWREKKPPPYRFKYAGESEDEDEDTQIESKIGGDAG